MKLSRQLLASAAAATTVLAGLVALPATPATAANPGHCSPVLDKPTLAADVLTETGTVPTPPSNPAVSKDLTTSITRAARAEAHQDDHTSTEDGDLWLDTCGRAFYTEPLRPERPAGTAGAGAGGATIGYNTELFPLITTFSLASRPQSSKTIYLDFNGYTLTNTAWNRGMYGGQPSVELPGYDTDGNPASFSDAEKIAVQNIWAAVAEDYAPFDVNVTTSVPGSGAIDRSSVTDNTYGTTVVITSDQPAQTWCGCGGIAFLGAFNDYVNHGDLQPAFVFTKGVGTGVKNISQAASHEVGHNVGLVHQGTTTDEYYWGHGAWGPIMGASYSPPVTQWSRGEYPNANSQQDETSVMATYGVPRRADDIGDTAATAFKVPDVLESGWTKSGVISTAADVDAYTLKLAKAASVDIDAAVSKTAPDLDVSLRILNAAGVEVAAANPPMLATNSAIVSGMGASLSQVSLSAGTYLITVDGVGFATPTTGGYSDYGSLGGYTLTVKGTYGAQPPATNAPLITTTALPGSTAGVAYATQLDATSPVGAAITWSLDSGKLPTGLTLTPTGQISGKASTKGSYALTLKATDANGLSSKVDLNLDVTVAITVSGPSITTATTDAAYNATLKITGGVAPYSVTAVSQPSWATVWSTGEITGVPTQSENATFDVIVTDVQGRSTAKTLKLYVNGPLRIETAALPYAGTVVAGASSSIPLTAVGGSRRYTWKPTESTLPAGVTLSTSGTLSVKKLAEGTYPLTVALSDSAGATTTRSYTLTAVPALAFASTTTPVTVGEVFKLTVSPSGGSGARTVTTTTVLPDGWTFDGTALTGTPTSTKSVPVGFKVVDATGRSLTKTVSISAKVPLIVTAPVVPAGTVGKSLRISMKVTGGYGTKTWSVASGTLPAGMTLSTSGVLSGVPTAAADVDVKLKVTDADGRIAYSDVLTLRIAARAAR